MKSIGSVVTVAIAFFCLVQPTGALSSTPELEPKVEVVGNVTYISGGIKKIVFWWPILDSP